MSRSLVLTRGVTAAAVLAAIVAGSLMAGTAGAECNGRAGVVACLDGSIVPRSLPRDRPAPVSVTLSGKVRADAGAPPPHLARMEVAFGTRGGLDTTGLPRCSRARLRNATAQQALVRCGAALVGRGTIEAEVPLNPQEPLLAHARVLAFNGRQGGRPVVWVHAYSASPPVSFVLPFFILRQRAGAYGMLVRAPVAAALGRWPRLRSFELTLGRRYRAGGTSRSYLSARCPLPPRFHTLTVPLARATYDFSAGPTISTTILRRCAVRD